VFLQVHVRIAQIEVGGGKRVVYGDGKFISFHGIFVLLQLVINYSQVIPRILGVGVLIDELFVIIDALFQLPGYVQAKSQFVERVLVVNIRLNGIFIIFYRLIILKQALVAIAN